MEFIKGFFQGIINGLENIYSLLVYPIPAAIPIFIVMVAIVGFIEEIKNDKE